MYVQFLLLTIPKNCIKKLERFSIKCQKWFAFAVVCSFVLLRAVVGYKIASAIFLNQLQVY